MSLSVGIVGCTGYVGQELARWVTLHPELHLQAATARSAVGRALGDVVASLDGLSDLIVTGFDAEALSKLDVVFLAVPHGASQGLAEALSSAPLVVDCARDHRHAAGWVYGQPEYAAEQLLGASRISAPGCFATALTLCLAPLVAAGVVTGPARVVAATGSTGSGVAANAATHHPERHVNLKAYKVLSHQHVPEVTALLAQLGDAPELRFVPWSAPIDRGILATCFLPVGEADAVAIVTDAYAHRPLIRLRDGSPELRRVRGTGFADISVHQSGDDAVVLCAIDNLGRGAAAQAVQALNISLGWNADLGLRHPAPLL